VVAIPLEAIEADPLLGLLVVPDLGVLELDLSLVALLAARSEVEDKAVLVPPL